MSQSGASAESARVRWLVAGAFASPATGRRFHLTSESFPTELSRAASGLRATVVDRLGAQDTRTVELSFDKLRAFQLSEVISAVPELRALQGLRDELSRAGLSPEAGAERVASIVGAGKLSEAVAAALRGTTPAPTPTAVPTTTSGAELVETLLNPGEPHAPAAASRAVDAFLRAITPKGAAPGATSSAAVKSAREVVEEAVLLTARDLLAAEPVARMESAWRGLKWLLDQCPPDAGMAVEVLDVAAGALTEALEAALAAEPFERPDACFVTDTCDDAARLGRMALLGEHAQVPMVVAVSPSLLGLPLAELSTGLEEARDEVPESWPELRQDESGRWLCVALNRPVVGSESKGALKRVAFASPAIAVASLLAASFRDTGSFARILGQPGGVRAPTTWEVPAGRDKGTLIPTEVMLPIRAQARLEERGILGLGSGRNADAVLLATAPTVFGGGYTVPLPAQLLTGRIVRFAQWVRDQLPAGSSGEDVSAIFAQAAEVFLFRGATELGQLRGELITTGDGRAIQVTATVPPEHAGTRFQLAFALPMRR
ncbi:type VI secretion system contractile sheath large subunit [Myxococcaceae bacterium JPH2]|nr:type VI secretion system contractile sheath large subunit [Myxococcaceae bacterium JPH2]